MLATVSADSRASLMVRARKGEGARYPLSLSLLRESQLKIPPFSSDTLETESIRMRSGNTVPESDMVAQPEARFHRPVGGGTSPRAGA